MPNSPTAAELADWRKLADEATRGPWGMWGMMVLADLTGDSEVRYENEVARTSDPERGLRTFNGHFIAAARTAVPRLLDELDRLRAVIRETHMHCALILEPGRHAPECLLYEIEEEA